jgi:hypothetical protein
VVHLDIAGRSCIRWQPADLMLRQQDPLQQAYALRPYQIEGWKPGP